MYVKLIIIELINYLKPVCNYLICNIIFKANTQFNYDDVSNKDVGTENSQIITLSNVMDSIQHLGHVLMNGNYFIINLHVLNSVI